MQSPLVTEALTTIDNSSVVKLCVTVEDHRILHSYGVYRNGDTKSVNISYEKRANGCIFGMDEKRELIANGDFFILSKKHLMLFLTSVHMLSSLSIIAGSTTSGGFLYKSYLHQIVQILQKRNNLLIVNEFVVSIPSEQSQYHVVSLVAMLDREALEEVRLKTTSSTTQWKNSQFLKEHCVRSPFGKLVLQCSFDGNQACELLGFGAPAYANRSIQIWFFPSQDQDVYIRMEHDFSANISTFTFSRVSSAQMLQETHPSSSPTFDLERLTGYEPVMTQIWENLPFISILALRDVSKELRVYLDGDRLHCWPIRMEIHFDENSAIVRMFCNGEEISRPCSDMALLKEWLNSQKNNSRNQNPSFETFLCDFNRYTLEKMQDLEIFMRSFNSKISMVHLELKGSREREFIKLLDCLDEKILRKLTLSSTEATVNNNNNILNLDELTNTVQWKHAIELVAKRTLISVSPEKCCHFLKVNAAFAKLDTNDVDFFVKTCIFSPPPYARNLRFTVRHPLELQSLKSLWGSPTSTTQIDGVEHHKWVFLFEKKYLEISIQRREDDVDTSILMRHLNN